MCYLFLKTDTLPERIKIYEDSSLQSIKDYCETGAFGNQDHNIDDKTGSFVAKFHISKF